MRAKSFFYVSLGILALAAAYHLGATNAHGQVSSQVAGLAMPGNMFLVLTPNGDIYMNRDLAAAAGGTVAPGTTLIGNFWSSATPTTRDSWGSVKARYRGERGAVTNTPTDR
jgi:hypothetical protein